MSDLPHRRQASESAASEALPDEEPEADIPLRELTTNDMFIKDAFLVFRALCKLTMKPLNSER